MHHIGGGRDDEESDSEAEEQAHREATTSKHQLSPSEGSKKSNKKQKTNGDIPKAKEQSFTALGLESDDDDSDA